ncbi:MAG: pyridoxamine 5'-phosphate oxidase [Chitinophagaceae bacterium]|nr:MAG: pyridoxamine 5'-phosphate oxidase [Chitinophagaceae bacterium]
MAQSPSHIASIRKDYQLAALDEELVGTDPLLFFNQWFEEAVEARVGEVNAFTLGTVDELCRPHARIVLLKGIDQGGFVFYTNYKSSKGKHIETNPFASMVFFWQELERQVRVEGRVEKVSPEESDAYFSSRPEGSQLGAWSSPQSQEISMRTMLDDEYQQYLQTYAGKTIPRPPHWGGYRVLPDLIEFWQGRSNRMHDRIKFQLGQTGWQKARLAP